MNHNYLLYYLCIAVWQITPKLRGWEHLSIILKLLEIRNWGVTLLGSADSESLLRLLPESQCDAINWKLNKDWRVCFQAFSRGCGQEASSLMAVGQRPQFFPRWACPYDSTVASFNQMKNPRTRDVEVTVSSEPGFRSDTPLLLLVTQTNPGTEWEEIKRAWISRVRVIRGHLGGDSVCLTGLNSVLCPLHSPTSPTLA